jgi:arylsulfatase A-like enzyme
VRGETQEIHEAVFAEVTYHAAYEPQRAARTVRWKYVRRFGERQSPVLPNCDDSPSKDLWMQHGWRTRRVAEEELYDLIFDPNEACNIAQAPSFRDVLAEMRSRLEDWMRKTDDPLLGGPVPAPTRARVNDPDGVSPGEPTILIPPSE